MIIADDFINGKATIIDGPEPVELSPEEQEVIDKLIADAIAAVDAEDAR